MNTAEFCTWLQGFLDAVGDSNLSPEQVLQVKTKLQSVFEKVTLKTVDGGETFKPNDPHFFRDFTRTYC